MALNDLIAQGAQFTPPPDPFKQYAVMQQLQQGQQQNALNQLAMQEKQRAFDEQNRLRALYQQPGFDIASPNALSRVGAINPKAAQDLGAWQTKMAQEKASAQKSGADAVGTALKNSRMMLDGVTTPEQYMQWHLSNHSDPVLGAWLKDRGSTPEQSLKTIQQALQTPGGFEQLLLQSKIGSEKALENHFVNQDTGGVTQTLQMPKYGSGPAVVVPGSTATKVVSPDTRATIASHEKIAQKRLDQETASSKYTPDTVDFLAQTYITTGQLPPMGMGKAAAEARAMVLDRAQQIATGKTAPGATPTATPAEAAKGVASNKQDVAGQTSVVKDFSSGVSSRRVTALNTALNHLDTMEKLSGDLANKDVRVFNAAANALAKQLGVAAPTSFDAARQIVANEVIKAVVANGGGVKERQEAAETFARANSPQQLQGVMKTYQELLGGQLSSLSQQYERGSGRKDFNKQLSPAAIKLLQPAAPAATPAATGGGWGKAEVVK